MHIPKKRNKSQTNSDLLDSWVSNIFYIWVVPCFVIIKISIDDFTHYYENINKADKINVNFDYLFMEKLEQAMENLDITQREIPDTHNDILNAPIRIEEVSSALKKAKNHPLNSSLFA